MSETEKEVSVVERVAHAIYHANDPTRDDPICVTLHHSEFIQAESLPEQLEEVMSICRSAARAALSELRSTKEMARAFYTEIDRQRQINGWPIHDLAFDGLPENEQQAILASFDAALRTLSGASS